ncbi:MAG: polyphosphate kinase 1 [Phycisphaeraceae bacterium]|nr:polyphosphate kinase 1 [Phycisphaeraceae bacterium]
MSTAEPARNDPRVADTVRETPAARALADIPARELFFNRDLSWLEFNRRVLALAQDNRRPLLERVKFLSIFGNNLDEFFMKRVGLLRRLARTQPQSRSNDGMTPAEQLAVIRPRALELLEHQATCWEDDLRASLEAEGVRLLTWEGLAKKQRTKLAKWYRANVFPVLTPLAVDPGHRFPFISNLSKNLGVLLSEPDSTERHFARVKIPGVVPGVIDVDDPGAAGPSARTLMLLDDIIAGNLGDLFPGMVIHDVLPFRVTRSAAVEVDDDEVDDLLEHVEEELRMRRFSEAVRLEVPAGARGPVLDLIREELRLEPADVYPQRGPLDYTDLFAVAELNLNQHKYEPWLGVTHPQITEAGGDIFAAIRKQDILVHHPYESFQTSVEKFIAAASRDPDVLAIKLTLYRTSPDSPFISSLIRAAESGKQVACLVEVRARFDEHRNVRFARQLEQAGVHVAYGVVGFKTHCKCSLVVRRESQGLRGYVHVSTGNYHPKTAQLYTDLGLFTADPAIVEDVIELFNSLTGRTEQRNYDELIVAPYAMRRRMIALIDREIDIAQSGGKGRIFAKMNALEDTRLTRKLYEASRAGVQTTLVVRGFCCLRPGVVGLSENIRVIAVIGRFLEHSRVYHFGAGKEDPLDGEWYIGSPDWMYRNLSNRVEVLVPVNDRQARARLQKLRDIHERDQRTAWDLQPDGSYIERMPPPDADPLSPEALGAFVSFMNEVAPGSASR